MQPLVFSLNIYQLYVKSDIHEKVNHVFPQNVNQLSKPLQSDMLDFKQYVVCTSCFSLYEFKDWCNVIEGCKFKKKIFIYRISKPQTSSFEKIK